MTIVVMLLIGALLPLAFAPINLYPLAILSPALLLLCWLNQSPKECFWRGWLFGLGFFGMGISWIFVSIHTYGETPWPVAIIFTALFVAVFALYPAIQGYLWARFAPHHPLANILIAFPASWVLLEWIRSWLFTGFPWLLLGHSQTASPLRGFAPLIGVYGVSFVTLLLSALLGLFILTLKNNRIFSSFFPLLLRGPVCCHPDCSQARNSGAPPTATPQPKHASKKTATEAKHSLSCNIHKYFERVAPKRGPRRAQLASTTGYFGDRTRSTLMLNISILLFFFLITSGYFFSTKQWTEITDTPIKASLIQGNIAQSTKWSPETLVDTVSTYQNLTHSLWTTESKTQNQLIIWPEAAVPLPYESALSFLTPLADTAKKNQTTLLLGIPFLAPEKDQYYNGILALGLNTGRYYKQQLVPFGEFVPFQHWLRGLINFFDLPMSDFISGPAKQPPLTTTNKETKLLLAPFICYEIAYSNLLRDRSLDTDLLVTVTNDAWFGNSFAPAQHLQIAQMASIQTARYQLFAANDGITAIINPKGEIIAQLPQFTQDILKGEVYSASGITPWMQWGTSPLLIILAGLWGLIAWLERSRMTLRIASPVRENDV